MRLDIQTEADAPVLVTLSRRNLLALLAKLSQSNSACAFESGNAYLNGELFEGLIFRIHAEEDSMHYEGRPAPGPVHPATEEIMTLFERMDFQQRPGWN